MNDLSRYRAVKEQMKTGDLLQWRSDSLIGKLICWKTGYDVSHSSLVLRLSEYEGLERRRFTTEALGIGTVLSLLSRRLEGFDGNLWWYPLIDDWDKKRTFIGEMSLSLIGIKYDYKSLIKQIFGVVSVDVQKLFCSEYVYLCYGFAGEAPYPGALNDLGIFKKGVQLI